MFRMLKLRPPHGWNAVAWELAIVVLGVLIALAAQQLVEALDHRAQVREAEGAMVAELRDDNLPQAYARAAIYNCYVKQLDAVQAAVASADREQALKLALAYRPVARTYDDQAWQAAVASQVLVHSGPKRMLGWSTAYRLVPVLGSRANAEQDELGQLYAAIGGAGALSPDQQDRLFQVVSTLQRQNRAMAEWSLVFIKFLAEQNLTLTRTQRAAILQDARKAYGSCVVEPAPERADSASQIFAPDDLLLGRK